MSVVIIREEVYVCVSEKQDFNLGAGDAFRSKDREITMLVRWYQPVLMYADTEALINSRNLKIKIKK